jgi:small multidrug resistance pump
MATRPRREYAGFNDDLSTSITIGSPMNYLYLSIAIIAEVIGTISLPLTNTFSRLAPSLVVVLCYGISFFLLSVVVRTISVAVVYAIWSGAGICLVAIAGAIGLRQTLDTAAHIGILLIIAGVIIINLFSKSIVH